MGSKTLSHPSPLQTALLLCVLTALLIILPATAISASSPDRGRAMAVTAALGQAPSTGPWQPVVMPPPPYVNLQVDLATDADAQYLSVIRQAIETRGWTAAFYATPEFAAAHPQALRDLLAQGHELGVLLDAQVTGLDRAQQAERLRQALAGVRQAAGLADGQPLHARFRDYVARYKDIAETVAVLESLGVPSLTGLLTVEGDFFCRYCGDNGRLMYPLEAQGAERLLLIPVASAAEPAPAPAAGTAVGQATGTPARVPLDDAALTVAGQPVGAAPTLAAALVAYDAFVPPAKDPAEAVAAPAYVHDKYLTVIVHPSATGADAEAMGALNLLLDRVAERGSALVSNEQIIGITAQVMAGGYIGSLSITPSEAMACSDADAVLAITYSATLYCPTYYFRVYGRYATETNWKLLQETQQYVQTGTYTFHALPEIPAVPANGDTTYRFLVVGQSCAQGSCGWPTPTSYEKKAETSVEVIDETIKEIKVTPNGSAETLKEVTLEAVPKAAGVTVTKVQWTISPTGSRMSQSDGKAIPAINGEGTPNKYKYTPKKDTYGEKQVTAEVTLTKNGKSCNTEGYKTFKLFFKKGAPGAWGDDDGDKIPNWFEYWKTDGAVTQLNAPDVRYDPKKGPNSWGSYDPTTDQIDLGGRAAMDDPTINVATTAACPLGGTFGGTFGIDTTAATLTHERRHKQIADNWRLGGLWEVSNARDSDDPTPGNHFDLPGDSLPNFYETSATQTLTDTIDSCNMAAVSGSYANYGDEEFDARRAESLGRGVVTNDWANPGKQSSPPYLASSAQAEELAGVSASGGPAVTASFIPTATVHSNLGLASLIGSYATFGLDLDGDGLFNELRLSAGVRVTVTDLYNLTAWLETIGGTPIAWAGSQTSLSAGTYTMTVGFDGRVIRTSGLDGPYRIARVELTAGPRELLVNAANAAHTTGAYLHTAFDPYDITVTGPFGSAGRDTGSDGKYDYLDVTVGLDAQAAGAYTVSAQLLGAAGGYEGSAETAAVLAAGSRSVTLAFDGREIRQRRGDGPYQLADVTVLDAAGERVAFALAPYTTTAFLASDFQPTAASLTGTYSDAGVDTNGNSLYDKLRLTAGIDVLTPGAYRLVGALSGTDGVLARASRDVTLQAGAQNAILDFRGLDISSQTANGPYTVTMLSLLDATGAAVSFEPGVYATDAYLAADFDAAGTISGTVRSAAGSVISDVVVYLAGPVKRTAVSDSAGRYAAADLPAGTYKLHAIPPDESFLLDEIAEVVVSSGEAAVGDFTLQGAGGITGRVSDFSGSNPLQALIDTGGFEPPHYTTGFDGSYRILGLPAGEQVVRITSDPGYSDWWIYINGRHVDNGRQALVTVTEGAPVTVDFRRPPISPAADLSVDKTLVQGVPGAGEDVTYRLRVRSLGTLPVSGIRVTDTLPAGATYVGDLPGAFTRVLTGTQAVWTALSLPTFGQAGAEASIDLTIRLPETLAFGDPVTNTLAVSSSVAEADHANDLYIDARAAVAATRDLSVGKSLFAGTPYAGSDIQYQISVFNSGNAAAPNLRVTDTLPANTTFLYQENSAGFGYEWIGGQVVWTGAWLSPESEAVFFVTLHVAEDAPPDAPLDNIAEASTSRPELDYLNNSASDNRAILSRVRDMAIGKLLTRGNPVAGAEPTFQLTVSNWGTVAAGGVLVTDTLPDGMSFVRAWDESDLPDHAENRFPATVSGQVITWSLGTVPPGGNAYLNVTTKIADSVPVGSELVNVAEVSTSDPDEQLGNNLSDYLLLIAASTCDMDVALSLYNGVPSPGGYLTYRMPYQNYGNSPCGQVVITNTLPLLTTYVSSSGPVTPTVAGGNVVWQLGAVAGFGDAGSAGILEVTFRLPAGMAVGTPITDVVQLTTATPQEGFYNNAAADGQTVLAPTPDLYVTKALAAGELVRDTVNQYVLEYGNLSASAAPTATIVDDLPAGMTFVSAGPITPTVTGSRLVWDLGPVPGWGYPGAYGAIRVNVRLSGTAPAGTAIANTAAIYAPLDTNLTNDGSTDTRPVADGTRDLKVTQEVVGGHFVSGGQVTYEINYENLGTAAATGVRITDTLPLGLTYTPTGSSLVTWDLGIVPGAGSADSSGFVRFTAQVGSGLPVGALLTNTVQIGTPEPESDYANNIMQHGNAITAPFRDMSVFTILEDGDLMTGQVVTYVVSVSNLGNVAAENVVLTGTLPLSTTYLSSQTETFFGAHAVDAFTPTVSNRQVVWTLGSVPGGGTGNLRIRARIDPGVPVGTNLSNTATVSTSSADAQPANNTSSVSGTVYAPDAYEPDDYFSQARPIASNGSRQHRSFHSAGDADWVWFTATVGLEYVISTSSLGSDANTYLYLYGADGVTVLVEDDDSGGGRASRIIWRAGQSEPFYVRVVNAGTEHGPGATYDLSVDGHPASPDLAVTKDPAGRLRGGSVAAYTIAYSNTGTLPATGVVMTDRLPLELTYSSDSAGGTPDAAGRLVTWNLGTLQPGAGGSVMLTVHVTDGLPIGAWITNTVEIATPDAERDTANNRHVRGDRALAPWGGPDAFGYTFRASNRPGGPPYAWSDIAATGTEVAEADFAANLYNFGGPFDIGFNFPFYGIGYDQAYINIAGYVSFGRGWGAWPDATFLPDPSQPTNVIMPFGGMQIYNEGVTRIHYQRFTNPERFVMQYTNLAGYGAYGEHSTFQVILYPNGTMETVYHDVSSESPPSLVGIQDGDGIIGLDYGTNVFGGLTVAYYPPGVGQYRLYLPLTMRTVGTR